MKKLLFLFSALLFISCSSEDSNVQEDCGCIKTTFRAGWATDGGRYQTITAEENVPCQDNEQYVSVSGNYDTSDNLVYYYICCENIDDPNSGCDNKGL